MILQSESRTRENKENFNYESNDIDWAYPALALGKQNYHY